MKRQKKVYQSEEEILKLIDDNDFELKSVPIMAVRCDALADEHYKWLNDHPKPNKLELVEYHERRQLAQKSRSEADRHRKRMGSLRGKQVLLKEKLAAMRTEIMPFMMGYKGVV